jgi:hypothetical protein
MKKFLLATAALCAIYLSSCKKNETTNPTPPANNPPQVNTPSDGYGVIGVVKAQASYTTPSVPGVPSMDIDYNIGTAFAAFSTSPGATTFVDAGNVTVNDSALTKTTTNSYAFTPKGAPTGSDIGLNTNTTTYNWTITGSSNVAAFTHTATGSLPSIGKINSAKDINTANSYTITLTANASNCDSIIWVMIGPSGNVQKITGPSTSSCTFSAAEVGSLGKGDNSGIVQVAPYRISDFTKNGKKYYYVRESCATMFVNLK